MGKVRGKRYNLGRPVFTPEERGALADIARAAFMFGLEDGERRSTFADVLGLMPIAKQWPIAKLTAIDRSAIELVYRAGHKVSDQRRREELAKLG
jgi:hypothetical protein